jgi:hypothetical protein
MALRFFFICSSFCLSASVAGVGVVGALDHQLERWRTNAGARASGFILTSRLYYY